MFTVPVGTIPNKDTILSAIEYNEQDRKRLDKLDKYYKGRHDILERVRISSLRDHKIVVNHAKYITDINVGYLLGNPVEYQAQDGVDIDLVLEEFRKEEITNIDHSIAMATSKFGRAYSLTYALPDNSLSTKLIDPRNCIIVYDDTMEHNKLFAVTYKVKDKKYGKTEYEQINVYTESEIQYWADDLLSYLPEQHSFAAIPVVEYKNNDDRIGDYEPVITLIDGYNTLASDRLNDKEQLVEAILVVYGVTMTREQKQELRDTRVMTVPSKSEGSQVEYLVKQLNETDINVLRSNIEADIHKISMTPNLSDENFVGNSSGVAIRYKLLAFEQSIANKERYFSKGLRERFDLYNNYLVVLSNMQDIQPYQIRTVFKRNLPQNDLETSQIINNLDGIVDRQTLVGELSFIENAEEVIEKARQEAIERAQQFAGQFGTGEPDGNNNSETE